MAFRDIFRSAGGRSKGSSLPLPIPQSPSADNEKSARNAAHRLSYFPSVSSKIPCRSHPSNSPSHQGGGFCPTRVGHILIRKWNAEQPVRRLTHLLYPQSSTM